MERDKLKKFLDSIAQVESAGGKYTNHPLMKSGIHKGMRAQGKYGIMPLTGLDVLKSEGSKDYSNLTPQEFEKVLKSNPELQEHIAESLANKVLSRSGGDEEKAAYMWNQGHNIKPETLTSMKLDSKPYVQKFRKTRGMIAPYPQQASLDIPKQESFPIQENSQVPVERRDLNSEQPEESENFKREKLQKLLNLLNEDDEQDLQDIEI